MWIGSTGYVLHDYNESIAWSVEGWSRVGYEYVWLPVTLKFCWGKLQRKSEKNFTSERLCRETHRDNNQIPCSYTTQGMSYLNTMRVYLTHLKGEGEIEMKILDQWPLLHFLPSQLESTRPQMRLFFTYVTRDIGATIKKHVGMHYRVCATWIRWEFTLVIWRVKGE